MKIEFTRVVDLSDEQLARCRELSFGDEGYMCEDLEAILEMEQGWRYRYSQAILLGDTLMDDSRLRAWPIYGWALLQPVYRSRKYSAQFFVDPGQRGNGYGKVLLEQANKWCNKPLCYIDEQNEGFFRKHPSLYDEFVEKDIAA